MDHFGFDQTNLVGLSQGTALGHLLAIRHPDRVASLTPISGTSDFSRRPGGDLPGPAPRPAETFAAVETDERDWADRDATVAYLIESERQVGGSISDEDLTREIAERTFDTTVSLPHQLIKTTMFEPAEPWRDRLGDIAAPTLVIHGSEDPMFPLRHGEAVAREIAHAQLLVLNGVGHGNLPRSSWRQVIDAIGSVAR